MNCPRWFVSICNLRGDERGRVGPMPEKAKRRRRSSIYGRTSLPEAKRRVKVGLILEAIAEKEGIRVEERRRGGRDRTTWRGGSNSRPRKFVGWFEAGGQDMLDEFCGKNSRRQVPGFRLSSCGDSRMRQRRRRRRARSAQSRSRSSAARNECGKINDISCRVL